MVSADRRAWSELELIRAVVLAGDQMALREVSSRLARCVNFVLNQYGWFKAATEDMREEIVDESLARLIERVQRGFDGVDVQFKTYVYRVVYSVTSSEIQHARKTTSLDQEVAKADGSIVPLRDLIMLDVTPWLGRVFDPTDPLEGMARAEQAGRAAEALAALNPKDREVLRLFEVEGLSTREVARRMGDTEGSISVRLHRCRDRMCRAYLRTLARRPSGVDETWIPSLVERLPQEEAAVMRIWWKEGGSVREIAKRLGIPEDRCKELLDRGKGNLARLAEETPRAS
jgi:RNA polymerase sigma factor (sigma-70 family)